MLKVRREGTVTSFVERYDPLAAFYAGHAPYLAPAKAESHVDGDFFVSDHTNNAQWHIGWEDSTPPEGLNAFLKRYPSPASRRVKPPIIIWPYSTPPRLSTPVAA